MTMRKPCMFCGRDLWAKYPYYKLLRQKNSWSAPKTVGRICDECIGKMKKETEDEIIKEEK